MDWGGDNLAATFGLPPIVAAAEWEGRKSWSMAREIQQGLWLMLVTLIQKFQAKL